MRRRILFALYCIALLGIGAHLLFDVKQLGIAGYAALVASCVMEIVRLLKKK